MANSGRPAFKPAAEDERDANENRAEEDGVPAMPRPSKIRLVGDQGENSRQGAHCDHKAFFAAHAARQYSRWQAPDEHPGGPVKCSRKIVRYRRGGATPPAFQHVYGRELEVDSQVDAEPEERFGDGIAVVAVSQA